MTKKTDATLRYNDPANPAFKLEEYPFYLMTRTMGEYYGILEQVLKTVGVDQPRWRALMILGEQNPCRIGDIARRSVIKLSTMTRIIQRMQKEGLVTSAPNPDDNRVIEVHLTDTGAEKLAKVKSVASKVFQKAIDGVDEEHHTQLIETLHVLYDNLRKSPYE